jgi:hypothetical protein
MESQRQLPKFRNMIATLAIILVGLVWFGIALPDQDWLWFFPIFNEQAPTWRLGLR